MSWELVERLKERFPAVEPFPRETAHDEAADGPGEQGETATPSSAASTAATARRAPRHDPSKGPVFHVPGAFVPPDGLLEVCRALRDEAPYHMDYCSFVSAIDRPANGTIEVIYHLYSTSERHEVLLKVRVPRDVPRVPSVTGIWAGANWHERETYDLFGVTFDSHPDLRRIMMTDDWSGHPLRKDYVYQEPRWLVDLVTQRQKEIEGLGLGERG